MHTAEQQKAQQDKTDLCVVVKALRGHSHMTDHNVYVDACKPFESGHHLTSSHTNGALTEH